MDQSRNFLESRTALVIVSALAMVLFLLTNLPWQLDDYDQAKQAFTSFEMIKEGHWLYQRTPHERVATKPPLIGWISSGIFSVTRSWAIAWRLPSLLSAIALSMLLFRADSVYGAVGGLKEQALRFSRQLETELLLLEPERQRDPAPGHGGADQQP